MNNLTSFLLGTTFGAGVGIILGATYMKKKVEDCIDDVVNEEVKRFIDECLAKDEEDQEEETPEAFSHYNSLKQPGDTYHKPDPTKLFNDPTQEHPQEPNDENDILEEVPEEIQEKREENDMKDPKLISEDEFDDNSDYEKDTLYYYQDDDILTDREEKEIHNDTEFVGNALDKFGFRDNEETIVHVRNFEKNTDYEVIKVFAAYRDNY